MTRKETPKTEWFTESVLPLSDGGLKISVAVNETLYDEEGQFGRVQVLDTPFYGHMLAIDGIIQVAEKDEFIYHEMMVTLPSIRFGQPKSLLIVGGGDGGAAKQALRIKSLEQIVMVEIDRSVIDVSQQFLPSVSEGALNDPRLDLRVEDGAEFVKNTKDKFDVVVLDLTDPVPSGPAERLFSEEFYREVKGILTPDGVVAMHCGALTIQKDEARMLSERLDNVFGEVNIHTAVIPTYQLTLFGFLIASDKPNESDKKTIEGRFKNARGPLKYLSPEIYFASQVLPPYLVEQVGAVAIGSKPKIK